jgi:catechol 2,3-dioxygenase-like lactoylglutathione lyase family enzyme
MKRFHVHIGVQDLKQSIRFYSALFAAQPSVLKDDYAKWQLDDPRVNFAISTFASKSGIDHLGIQAEDGEELEDLGSRLAQADVAVTSQKGASCCYAKSDKYWTLDPQGIAWDSFHTLDSAPVYGKAAGVRELQAKPAACCAPAVAQTETA